MMNMEIKKLKNILDDKFAKIFKEKIINNDRCFILDDGTCFCIDCLSKTALVLVDAENVEDMGRNWADDGELLYEEDYDSIEKMYDDIVKIETGEMFG